MRSFAFSAIVSILIALIVPSTAAAQSSTSIGPEAVVVSSGALRLTGLLWKPTGSGPFPVILFNHGASRDQTGAEEIGPVFARHGYVFLYLFRRGHGLSATQGDFMGDVLVREVTAEARRRLQLVLLNTDQLDDVTAGLSFLKNLRSVDSGRIAVAGHSFGGQLTLLALERDSSIRAAITFAQRLKLGRAHRNCASVC